jgi:hypothetical protein
MKANDFSFPIRRSFPERRLGNSSGLGGLTRGSENDLALCALLELGTYRRRFA